MSPTFPGIPILLLVIAHASHAADALPSFRNDIQPILFKMGCNTGACHGAAAGQNGFGLSLRGFDHESDYDAITRHANGRRVNLAQPDQSLILLKPTQSVAHEGGERFTKDSEPYRVLLEWLMAGAPGPSADDPVVTRIEVTPGTVAVGDTPDALSPLAVTAFYSDGSHADVTRWAKYDTTDDAVALVGEDGVVSVMGPGGASISVWYASKVATAQVSAPYADVVPDAQFAAATRNNFIDDLVIEKLKQLQIPPAGSCSDTEFVRRAYLDTIGTLPRPSEVFAFVLDNASDKRARLIDTLLQRPEFVDYWSYKWSDLLLVSSKNLPQREEMSAFYRYIRDSVEANKPWDQFAREILTATGSTRENGAANYFVMHKEKIDLTETTSQAFLGMSITCARCHNHPLEKWTQNDYYGMANLFARVKLKNGDRGDTEVLPAVFGEVPHPRTGRPLPPKPLDAPEIDTATDDDRRAHLAQWVTSPDNPYFTRAIVNRVWKNFMGRGLVEPEDDLRLTNPPTNAALMDALAAHLAENQYDLKALMRTIMNSAAYQRTSAPADPAKPDTAYYSHYIVRRLSAEVILDAYSQVSGVPTSFDGYPEGFRALQLPDSRVGSYFLSAFGRPERIQTCSCERTDDPNIAQALHVANGDTLNKKLRGEKSLLAQLSMDTTPIETAIDDIYARALSRYPTDTERAGAMEWLHGLTGDERRAALEDLSWAILSSKEFLFNH